MFRFFIDSDQIEGGVLSVTGGDVNHIRNVLRMKIGDDIEAVDENGNVATCRIRESPRMRFTRMCFLRR